MPSPPTCPVPRRRPLPVWLGLLPLFAFLAACGEMPMPGKEVPESPVIESGSPRTGSTPKPTVPMVPPQVTAKISRVRMNLKDSQQLFTLSLTNAGDKSEIVHAIIYAKNDDIMPPRRAISPPTAAQWFKLAGSKDGKLTPQDIVKWWKADVFLSGRGGRLRKSFDEKVPAEATINVECHHDLEETSPHPEYKGKRYPAAGYTDYQVWLFTPDGQLFFDQSFPANITPPAKTDTKRTTAKNVSGK